MVLKYSRTLIADVRARTEVIRPIVPCTNGGSDSSGGTRCLYTEAAEQLINHVKQGTIFLWPSFSVICKSSHSNFILCTALALLSLSAYAQHNTTLHGLSFDPSYALHVYRSCDTSESI